MQNENLILKPLTKRYIEESLQSSATRFVRNAQNTLTLGISNAKKEKICDDYISLKMIANDLNLDIDKYIIIANPQFWWKLEKILGVLNQ